MPGRLNQHNHGLPTIECKRYRAFTLIELLVVISIIALLVGILLPALGAARKSAMVLKCSNGEKQILIAVTAYTIDNEGLYPAGWMLNPSGPNDVDAVSYDDQLAGYDGREALTEAQMLLPYAYVGNSISSGSEFYRCPLDEVEPFQNQGNPTQFFRRSYSMSKGDNPLYDQNKYKSSPGLTNYNGVTGKNPVGSIVRGAWSAKDGEVTKPSSTIALCEFSYDINTMGLALHGNVGPDGQSWSGYAGHEYNTIGHHDGVGLPDTYSDRLNNRTNYAFADGHVEGLSLEATLAGIANLSSRPSDYRGTMWDHKQ